MQLSLLNNDLVCLSKLFDIRKLKFFDNSESENVGGKAICLLNYWGKRRNNILMPC
jgi:hypothetical protein